MKVVISIPFLIVLIACNNHIKKQDSNTFRFPDSALQRKIRDTLRTFPFMKRAQAYFDSVSNHKQSVTFIMDTFRNKILPTAVYYNEDKKFEKLYRFEVDPQTMEIKIGNIETGEFIPIEEYYKLNPQDKN